MEEIDEDIEVNNINSTCMENENENRNKDEYLPHMYLNDGNDYPQNITDDEDYGWE